MNPNLLKQLAVIVKQGSISRACEQLYVTQPTLTRSIQILESKVGAPVLTRSRYGVEPTEIGARLAQIGERILQDSEQCEDLIRQWHSGSHQEFVIGIDPLWEFATVDTLTSALLAEKSRAFHLRTASAAAQIKLLQEGELDFSISHAHLSVPQGELEREILFRDRTGVFAGKKSKLVGAKGIVSREILESQSWMVAGASAGFLDTRADLTTSQSTKIAMTGSIRTLFHLLDSTDMLVRLPARLTLMTGLVSQDQLIEVDNVQEPRRDLALWTRADRSGRPEILKVRELIRQFVLHMDKQISTFNLNL